MGDLLLERQCFGKVTRSEVFDKDFQCIVGLAYPAMKAGKDWHVPFFDTLMMDHGINSFAFNLENESPRLEFNPVVDEEVVEWHPVVNQLFWSLELDKVTLHYQGKDFSLCDKKNDNCWITPDSGSSALTAPTWAHKKLTNAWFPKGSECALVADDDFTLT